MLSITGKSAFVHTIKKEEEENTMLAYQICLTLQEREKKEKDYQTLLEKVPKAYHNYLDQFSEEESNCMPTRKPWDHMIKLKDSFKLQKGHIYPLGVNEQAEVSVFIDEQLRKGYIRPSRSLQTSPVFFVPKKDGKKRMVQDYCYLNKHMVKNNYPLPLISQLVDKLKGAKLFTKMGLR